MASETQRRVAVSFLSSRLPRWEVSTETVGGSGRERKENGIVCRCQLVRKKEWKKGKRPLCVFLLTVGIHNAPLSTFCRQLFTEKEGEKLFVVAFPRSRNATEQTKPGVKLNVVQGTTPKKEERKRPTALDISIIDTAAAIAFWVGGGGTEGRRQFSHQKEEEKEQKLFR